jgi:hypothetical protein
MGFAQKLFSGIIGKRYRTASSSERDQDATFRKRIPPLPTFIPDPARYRSRFCTVANLIMDFLGKAPWMQLFFSEAPPQLHETKPQAGLSRIQR